MVLLQMFHWTWRESLAETFHAPVHASKLQDNRVSNVGCGISERLVKRAMRIIFGAALPRMSLNRSVLDTKLVMH